jgi:ligand-binding sensor domain-containing protein
MKNQGSLVAIIAVCVVGLAVVLVGSLAKKPRIVESQAVAESAVAVEPASTETPAEPAEQYPAINTVLVDQGRLVMGTDDGIYLLPDFSGDYTPEKRDAGIELQHLTAILPMGENRYAGGDGLYMLDDNYSMLLDSFDLGRRVYALMEFGEGILVGSEAGLWYHNDFPVGDEPVQDTLLKEDVIVTALAEDEGGLWMGTQGDGLYRFDGQHWRERFLQRDSAMFDYVNALEYTYPFLWVGTDEAIFRYNGGKWAQMFVADSSETYRVTCIMTTPAATYIGTDSGLLRFAQDTLVADEFFDGSEIIGLCRSTKGVIVATRTDGIFTYNGKEEIVSPEQLTPHIFARDDNTDVIAGTAPEEYTEGADY